MPQIIVTADSAGGRGDGAVMLMERINAADFDSQHFASQLVERLGWAVSDAHEAECEARGKYEARGGSDYVDEGGRGLDRQPRIPESGLDQPGENRPSASVVTTAS